MVIKFEHSEEIKHYEYMQRIVESLKNHEWSNSISKKDLKWLDLLKKALQVAENQAYQLTQKKEAF